MPTVHPGVLMPQVVPPTLGVEMIATAGVAHLTKTIPSVDQLGRPWRSCCSARFGCSDRRVPICGTRSVPGSPFSDDLPSSGWALVTAAGINLCGDVTAALLSKWAVLHGACLQLPAQHRQAPAFSGGSAQRW